ncbi:MAG: hypothetical protein JWN46_2152, partial [Acidimicrobiales bacterium]|nr:hypothetical protein [Acidimicrobiales bacterium]
MLFPTTCPGCERVGPAPCPACVTTMARAGPVPVPAGLDACRALLAYEGAAREVVAQVKYRNARDVVAWLALGLARLVPPGEVDVVTWAPTTPARRRSRGFDHAQLLARRVGRELALPCRPLLRRLPGPPQTGRSSIERRAGPGFAARAPLPVGIGVLVVDDVVTTGATIAAAGRALR